MYHAEICNITALSLFHWNGRTPYKLVAGQMPDISKHTEGKLTIILFVKLQSISHFPKKEGQKWLLDCTKRQDVDLAVLQYEMRCIYL
jgi:hypothetical protein